MIKINTCIASDVTITEFQPGMARRKGAGLKKPYIGWNQHGDNAQPCDDVDRGDRQKVQNAKTRDHHNCK